MDYSREALRQPPVQSATICKLTKGKYAMGFFDDLQSQASELFGGASDMASDAGADLSNLSTDVQEQITQYAEDHNISIEAAKEHLLGGDSNN